MIPATAIPRRASATSMRVFGSKRLLYILPDSDALFLRDEQFAFLDVESVVPLINLGKGTIDTNRVRRVDILIEEHVHILLTVVACPHAGPAEEEALVGSLAVYDTVVAGVVECLSIFLLVYFQPVNGYIPDKYRQKSFQRRERENRLYRKLDRY